MSQRMRLNLALASIMAAGFGDVVGGAGVVSVKTNRNGPPELTKPEPRRFTPTGHTPHQGKKEIARRRAYWLKHRVLTDEAQSDRDDFDNRYGYSGCTCFISPPCSWCTHPGNPLAQEDDDTCWRLP